MPLCPQVTNTPVPITFGASYSNSTLIAGDVPATVEELENVEVQVIGKNHIYRQASPPDGSVYPLVEGDCWFDTDDGNKQYYWTGSAWVSVQDLAIQAAADAAAAAAAGAAAAQAAAAAADAAAVAAQTTADGKNKIYRQTTQPSGGTYTEGDLWFDTDDDNKIYRYTSGSWGAAVVLGNNALASISANKITAGTIDASVITVSNINAGNISTGYLAAARIEVASISGDKLTARTIEAAKIAVGTISATEIATGTITADRIAARTITADRVALYAITADEIAGATITAAEIASETITAAEIAAGSITVDRLTVGTLTGFTIQTSGSNRIRMQDSTNSINFIVGGTQRAHLVPAGTNGVIMHYGTTPNSNATSYPLVFVSAGSVVVAQSSTKFLEVSSLGVVANGDLYSPSNFYNQDTTTTTNAANTWMSSTTGLTRRSTASSLRYKENVVDIRTVENLDPKKLLEVPVRAFTYKSDYLDENDDRSGVLLPGFIAEEVAQTYPVAADLVEGVVESWNDRYVVPALLALVQDLEARVKILENK